MRAALLCSISADTPFRQAAEQYLRLRSIASTPGAVSARYIRKNTEKDYERKLRAVSLFFGDSALGEIRWYNMRAYQEARLGGCDPFIRKRQPHHKEPRPCPAKPKQVNQEMGLLKQLKMRAGCWTSEDQAYFEFLQEDESDEQRALTPEEQQRWLDTSRSNPRWSVILWWSTMAFDTLMSTNEIRGLRLGDVNLHHRLIRVPWPASKNRFRHREIPLENAEALWAIDQLLIRAHDLGSRDPQHYLFPFRISRSKISHPDRQMTESGIKKLWEEVRLASGLKWLRMYDSRHTGATRLAEAGVPTEIIVARMGHCSDKMRRHYTHVSSQAQRQWLRSMQPQYGPPPRFGPRPASSPDLEKYFRNRY